MRSIFLSGLALTAIANGETLAQPAPAPVPSINVSRAVAEDAGHANIPIAIWAPSTGQGLGLIVISHGTGAGPTAHIDTAQALANSGFVVVAPMHPGGLNSALSGRPVLGGAASSAPSYKAFYDPIVSHIWKRP